MRQIWLLLLPHRFVHAVADADEAGVYFDGGFLVFGDKGYVLED